MEEGIYNRDPIEIHKGIPVFYDTNEYVENYEKISQDHIDAITADLENPFIANEVWKEIEKNTIDALADNIKEGDKVLDVGVGTGRLLKHFPYADKYGVDVSMHYLERLVESDIEICLANVEALPYSDNFFDVIVCTDVLEHVIEFSTAIAEIERVLKHNGTFILRVPYKEDLSAYLKPDFPYKYAHVRSFDEFSLEIMLCRVFDFSLKGVMPDYTMYPDAIKGKQFFRGRKLFVQFLRTLSNIVPSQKQAIMATFFRPIEVTMILRLRK